MQCDICHKNKATVHLTEIINDKVVEMHVCGGCAKIKTEEIKEHLTISDFLKGFVENEEVSETKERLSLKCSFCGLTYDEFKKKGRLGCQNCYKTFKVQLLPLLRKIHSSVRHIGKLPLKLEKTAPTQLRKEELQRRLERAIHLEEYEEAARLRDEIKKIGSKSKK
jgi:protein arginine kinase activator